MTKRKKCWIDDIHFEPGEYVWIKKKHHWHKNKLTGEMRLYAEDLEVYPWAACDEVLAKVIFDHPRYVTIEIQPHLSPDGYDYSQPYKHSIHKSDIYTQRTMIKRIG